MKNLNKLLQKQLIYLINKQLKDQRTKKLKGYNFTERKNENIYRE